jgi:hypothetical protein
VMSEEDENFRKYFRRKIADWNISDPNYDYRFYVREKGKTGLIQEFSTDMVFQRNVRQYLIRIMNEGEEDLMVFRTALEDSLILLREEERDIFEREVLETILVAVLEASGIKKLDIGLVKGSLVTLLVAVSIYAVLVIVEKENEMRNDARMVS